MEPEYSILKPRLLRALKGKKTARGCANALYKALREHCAAIGANPDKEVHMWTPAQIAERRGPHGRGCYVVSYESGPYQWAVSFSMCAELKRLMEPHYSFDLCIYTADDSAKRAAV